MDSSLMNPYLKVNCSLKVVFYELCNYVYGFSITSISIEFKLMMWQQNVGGLFWVKRSWSFLVLYLFPDLDICSDRHLVICHKNAKR